MSEKDFLAHIEQYKARIHKICRVYRDHPEDQQDCFQEILYQLWKSYPSFKGNANIGTWIYRVSLNIALAYHRKRQPPVVFSSVLPEVTEQVSLEAVERKEDLLAAIKLLREADRALLVLYLDELSYQQMAEVTGLSESNVGVKLNRIKKQLMELIKKSSDGKR